jgi:SagB-type dehydrogenase family enzyme
MSHDQDALIAQNRAAIRPSWADLRDSETPRDRGDERPPLFHPLDPSKVHIPLMTRFPHVRHRLLHDVIAERRSLRQYGVANLSFEEVSYLLYETARVTEVRQHATFRTIPTGGATNAMETYVYIHRVDGIDRGLYHYQQTTHTLQRLSEDANLPIQVNEGLYRQLRNASIAVVLTCVPARSEYKYGACAHKMIAMEAGHAAQNLSLAAEVVDAGACCIAAYDQEAMDDLLGLDVEEEFVTYAITVGKH